MWLSVAALVGLYYLLRWYWERQVVSHLQDKYVFITGCDSGFGNLLARQLDLRGLRVLAACLTEEGAQQLRAQRLWGLVNNAGIFHPHCYSEWLKMEDYMDVLKVNLIGLIELTLSMLPLVRRARGRIVNVSSILGRIAFFGGVYCSSKYGVEAFSDVLRRELQHFGVKISIVEPGYFRTGMTESQRCLEKLKQAWEEVPVHIKEAYGQKFFDTHYDGVKQGLLKCSTNLNLVTDCMEHALTSVHPRTRYSAGWDSLFFFIPLSYLPTSLSDYILTRSWPKPAQAV
ncbi:PREDICTED: 17-beta-hydroxysteroid dehydrogenase type 6 [Odobenus rosmarus divergens]|uniref:17-beta-hydroxysteroid dehydrogenase type 6 n=1 Tax=Odobenus rosmarus divergens TaxID=9708 RepID=A0A2U3W1K3_ODORO|nr:PREDICTED: 17-beta-hydroxysteroid dehydrogenase type 6 [Odobenus rosmarus divergens]